MMPDMRNISHLKSLFPGDTHSLDWTVIVCCTAAFLLSLLPAFYCFALWLHGFSFQSALGFFDIDYGLRSDPMVSMKWGWFIPWTLNTAGTWLPIEFFGTLFVSIASLGVSLHTNKTKSRIVGSIGFLLSMSSCIFCIVFFLAVLHHMKPLHFV